MCVGSARVVACLGEIDEVFFMSDRRVEHGGVPFAVVQVQLFRGFSLISCHTFAFHSGEVSDENNACGGVECLDLFDNPSEILFGEGA